MGCGEVEEEMEGVPERVRNAGGDVARGGEGGGGKGWCQGGEARAGRGGRNAGLGQRFGQEFHTRTSWGETCVSTFVIP